MASSANTVLSKQALQRHNEDVKGFTLPSPIDGESHLTILDAMEKLVEGGTFCQKLLTYLAVPFSEIKDARKFIKSRFPLTIDLLTFKIVEKSAERRKNEYKPKAEDVFAVYSNK